MYEKSSNNKNTIVIFYPFDLKNISLLYISGNIKSFNEVVTIFFVTNVFDVQNPKISQSLFFSQNCEDIEKQNNLIILELRKEVLVIKKIKIQGKNKVIDCNHIIWINYNFKLFLQCEIISSKKLKSWDKESYFQYLKEEISEQVNKQNKKKVFYLNQLTNNFFNLLGVVILKLSFYNSKLSFVTKYFNITIHIENYLNGLLWAIKTFNEKKKLDIALINFILSVLLDMIVGILFLRWLNTKILLDSSIELFLFTTESVVNSIKDLINWLRGDPAGLKLNWAFNQILASFFSFHIDVWWTFIAFITTVVEIIFKIFLKLGLLGITFQASITADLLALVSFHTYLIYAYAAKLYSVQISSLMSLWRLFFGQKKNPLRKKVDSCIYSPEQLFVGTLGFTILLFLLPTTLLYYVVFTCLSLLILAVRALLVFIMPLNHMIPAYSTFLWIIRSQKISSGIEIALDKECVKSEFIILYAKPIAYSWTETINQFIPDCAVKHSRFNFSNLLGSIIRGKIIFPL